jgi:hypothetical protein
MGIRVRSTVARRWTFAFLSLQGAIGSVQVKQAKWGNSMDTMIGQASVGPHDRRRNA